MFSFYIDDDPTHIRRLLLICRRWYDTIVHQARFWTTIRVITDVDDEILATQARANYIERCLARSRGLPLDIFCDLSNLKSMTEISNDAIYQYINNILAEATPRCRFTQRERTKPTKIPEAW